MLAVELAVAIRNVLIDVDVAPVQQRKQLLEMCHEVEDLLVPGSQASAEIDEIALELESLNPYDFNRGTTGLDLGERLGRLLLLTSPELVFCAPGGER